MHTISANSQDCGRYILVDLAEARAAAAPPGSHAADSALEGAKKLTSIVMDQVSDALRIRYGNKIQVLRSDGAKMETDQGMAEMRSIVGDVVSRLDADFSQHDLYMALGALDL